MSLAIIQLVPGSEESQPHNNEKTKSRAQLETGRGQGIPSVDQENLSLSPPPLCASCDSHHSFYTYNKQDYLSD